MYPTTISLLAHSEFEVKVVWDIVIGLLKLDMILTNAVAYTIRSNTPSNLYY